MAEKFDARHASKLENSKRLVEPPPAGLVQLLRLDRPVGPPNDRVPAAAELHAVVTGMGLTGLAACEPGEIGLYHVAIVAGKPVS